MEVALTISATFLKFKILPTFKRGQREMYVHVYMYFPTDNTYFISNFQLLQTGLLLMSLLVIHFWNASYQVLRPQSSWLSPPRQTMGLHPHLSRAALKKNIKILSSFHAVHTCGCFQHKGHIKKKLDKGVI